MMIILIMRKYLPHVVQQLISPPVTMQSSIFSLSRLLSKRNAIKECKRLWGYHHQDQIDREIGTAYFGFRDTVKVGNSPMVFRYLSIELYQQYMANPECFKIEEGISHISILDGAKSKNEETGVQWMHLEVIIKHFNVQHSYEVQRRIYNENYQFQSSFPRKWYFRRFPRPQ